jgi:hypothetical protein
MLMPIFTYLCNEHEPIFNMELSLHECSDIYPQPNREICYRQESGSHHYQGTAVYL